MPSRHEWGNPSLPLLFPSCTGWACGGVCANADMTSKRSRGTNVLLEKIEQSARCPGSTPGTRFLHHREWGDNDGAAPPPWGMHEHARWREQSLVAFMAIIVGSLH